MTDEMEIPAEIAAEVGGLVGAAIERIGVEEFVPQEHPPVGAAPGCIICGASPAVSRTGRCLQCKNKRLPNNKAKIAEARDRLPPLQAQGSPPQPIVDVAALEREILQLRHLLSAKQILPLADFRERIELLYRANVSSYDDGVIKVEFKPGAHAQIGKVLTPTDSQQAVW